MEHYISPTQIIYSSLSGTLRHINRVTATLILPTKKHEFFQVIGEAIRNSPSPNKEAGKMIHRKDSKGEVLRALLSKWQDSMKEPIIRTYGTFCLEQSSLARFRFLLLIEALEGEYDSIHKTEIETEKTAIV